MKSEEYYRGRPGRKYGIWNTNKSCFQFNISEDSPCLAEARLFYKIGRDAHKWRFEAKILPDKKIPIAPDAYTSKPCSRCICNTCQKSQRSQQEPCCASRDMIGNCSKQTQHCPDYTPRH